jgi:ATP-dependent Zn protease
MQVPTEYSDSTAELIDNEVRNIINEQYEKALEILKSKRDILDKGAEILLDKEKIEGEVLKTLIEEHSKGSKK